MENQNKDLSKEDLDRLDYEYLNFEINKLIGKRFEGREKPDTLLVVILPGKLKRPDRIKLLNLLNDLFFYLTEI
jgi:hypothetical protein